MALPFFCFCVSVGFKFCDMEKFEEISFAIPIGVKKTLSVVFLLFFFLLNTFTFLGRLFWNRQVSSTVIPPAPSGRQMRIMKTSHFLHFLAISWQHFVMRSFFCFLGGGFDCRIPEGSLTQQWGGGDTSIWHTCISESQRYAPAGTCGQFPTASSWKRVSASSMALRWQICLLCSQESPDLVSLSSMVSQRSSVLRQSGGAALQKRCNTAGFTLFSRVVCQPNRNVTGKNLVDFFPFLEVRRSESESASTFRSNLQRMEGGVGSLRNQRPLWMGFLPSTFRGYQPVGCSKLGQRFPVCWNYDLATLYSRRSASKSWYSSIPCFFWTKNRCWRHVKLPWPGKLLRHGYTIGSWWVHQSWKIGDLVKIQPKTMGFFHEKTQKIHENSKYINASRIFWSNSINITFKKSFL